MKLLIATHNPGKFDEIKALLEPLRLLGFECVSLNEFGVKMECEETGLSYEDNALLKARFYSKLTRLPTVADDSGIEVEALGKELGVQTRRWGAGALASDLEWLDFFMNRMKSETKRSARFLCAAAFVCDTEERCFLGETKGVITEALEAPIQAGIPLSSVFKPEGFDRVYNALSIQEKNRISHRGKAFELLLSYLQTQQKKYG